MRIGNRDFDTKNNTYIMGILNVTPDSFSDGGKFQTVEQALKQVEKMVEEGADIIDIGGESTRPGHICVSEEEEVKRVVPIIREIKKRFNIPISLDTYKSEVARVGVEEGIDLINDIWGLRKDKKMAEVIAKAKVACCLMHNRKDAEYKNFMQEVLADLSKTIQIAESAGIEKEKIILDPGVGFGKEYGHNLEIINRMEQLHMFGHPILLATSRKSVIGLTLNLPQEERMEGTLVTTVIAVMKGCSFVRVHDVKENVRAVRMAEAIKRAQ